MITIGELAMRVMVHAYRELRANGICRPTSGGTFGTLSQFDELWKAVQVETMHLGEEYKAPRKLFPYVADMAYAIAMTEQFHLGSEMYNAWREYEIALHRKAIQVTQ